MSRAAPPALTATAEQTAQVARRLAALTAERPEAAAWAAFFQAALPLLRAAEAAVEPAGLEPEAAQRKLARGEPLLLGEDLPLDPDATRQLFVQLCRAVEALKEQGNGRGSGHRGQPRAAAARDMRRAVERGRLRLEAVWAALAAGENAAVENVAATHQVDPGLLRMLAESSLKPAMRAWAKEASANVDLDEWGRGFCPVCGGPPLLAEIQGKEGARRLRCGLCGAGWYVQRLRCPHCGNGDHRTLGQITVDGEEEKYRAQVCDVCHGYVKVVVTFDPTPVEMLAVEDLATQHLDELAAGYGYVRAGTTSQRPVLSADDAGRAWPEED